MTQEEIKQKGNLSEDERQAAINALYAQKVQLLNTFGIFGGGVRVNELHKAINRQLEDLGVDPDS